MFRRGCILTHYNTKIPKKPLKSDSHRQMTARGCPFFTIWPRVVLRKYAPLGGIGDDLALSLVQSRLRERVLNPRMELGKTFTGEIEPLLIFR